MKKFRAMQGDSFIIYVRNKRKKNEPGMVLVDDLQISLKV